MKSLVTAIVLTKNEASMIESCLACLQWCAEIIVVDDSSTDATRELAEKMNARVTSTRATSFALKRSEALGLVRSDWVLYVDADERVTPELAREIDTIISSNNSEISAITIPRNSVCYGHALQHGGWSNESVTRVFRIAALEGWKGDIHESPVFHGAVITTGATLLHLTHRSTKENLLKSAEWTEIEARKLYESKVPTVSFFTLLRKGIMEFWRRAVVNKGYRDGMPGLVESTVQAFNRVVVYVQVWELQQRPALSERYQKFEQQIEQEWARSKAA
jgi:glycosyltransferase involved in cell wall biosynthesis